MERQEWKQGDQTEAFTVARVGQVVEENREAHFLGLR